jgi:hypothetical protein
MALGIGIGISSTFKKSGFDFVRYWTTLISATVENAAPTHVVLTFSSAAALVAADFTVTVNAANRVVNSASWTGSVLTLALASAAAYADTIVVTFVTTGGTAVVTNNVAGEAETATLVNRFTAPATDARKRLINTAIKKLKDDGVFAKHDAICLIGNDAQCSLQNWIKNGINGTAVNSPIFVSDRYFQGDAISMYVSTGFNGTTAGQLFSRNSASFWLYFIAAATSGTYSGRDLNMIMKGDDGTATLNCAIGDNVLCGAGPGLLHCIRIDANTLKGYKNGGITNTNAASTSLAILNGVFDVFRYGATYNNSKRAGWGFCELLDDTDALNLKNAIEAYMDAIGAGIIP